MSNELYVNKGQGILLDIEGRFIYEVSVHVIFNGVFILVNSTLYASKTEILNTIETYPINKHIELCCSIYAAPKNWLIDNNFVPYIKKVKIKKIKTSKNE